MPRGQVGVIIGSFNTSDSFVGFIYGLVGKVLTDQPVNCNGFIRTFSQLWKGSANVSIKEMDSNSFWVRFVCDYDK